MKNENDAKFEWIDVYEIRECDTNKIVNVAQGLTEEEFARQFSDCISLFNKPVYAEHKRRCILKEETSE